MVDARACSQGGGSSGGNIHDQGAGGGRVRRKPHEAHFGATDAWTRKWLNDYWLEGMFGTAFDEARGIPAPGK